MPSPIGQFGPILRGEKVLTEGTFIWLELQQKQKNTLKHKLLNNDYRRCPRWPILLELHKKKYFSKPNLKKTLKKLGLIFSSSQNWTPFIL